MKLICLSNWISNNGNQINPSEVFTTTMVDSRLFRTITMSNRLENGNHLITAASPKYCLLEHGIEKASSVKSHLSKTANPLLAHEYEKLLAHHGLKKYLSMIRSAFISRMHEA